jgi:hypothetical protein
MSNEFLKGINVKNFQCCQMKNSKIAQLAQKSSPKVAQHFFAQNSGFYPKILCQNKPVYIW